MKQAVPRKVVGEQAECVFQAEAMRRGFIVSKPYGDSAPYDFVVQSRRLHGAPLWRVQVKSASSLSKGQTYVISTRHCKGRYRLDELDFFAAWVAPVNAWYIIPARAIVPRTYAGLYPHVTRTRSMYEKYREAWHLLG